MSPLLDLQLPANPTPISATTEIRRLRAERDKLLLKLHQSKARFETHLEAWRKNNAWHAARIAELEGVIDTMRGTGGVQ